MDPLGWHDLAAATQGRLIPSAAWGRASRIVTDSRELARGDVFWALRGERFDGHEFAAQALASGASLVVCELPRADAISGPKLVVDDTTRALGRLARWVRQRREALIIGVTGSVGKTTTKDLLAIALGQQFQGLKSPGNYNNAIGLPKTLMDLNDSHEFAVLEMGASQRGDIRDLCEVALPEIGVITNIGQAHMASFGSPENIVMAKGELLEALPATGFAVLPGDDPVTRSMAAKAPCRVLFVGTGPENDLQARHITRSAGRLTFEIDDQTFDIALPSASHLTNALLAIAVAREVGVPLDLIADGLQEFQPAPGRGALLSIGPWSVIDDTYNASPSSMLAAIEHLASVETPQPTGKRYAFLGDMRELGESSASEHRRVGAALASAGIHGLLAFGSAAKEMAYGAQKHGLRSGQIAAGESLDVLLTVLDCWLEPGDVVLIKGSRVMQTERVIDWLKQRAAQSTVFPARQCA
ncbi:UDP-N-acetylmuramoyl-tripeptide--D-alanyl-D-alanine ligase [bacterium]|nr:UDP-N-acetylmuramoyl-tripeptide--D-alanyl-D-alanine ligase [bacterium]